MPVARARERRGRSRAPPTLFARTVPRRPGSEAPARSGYTYRRSAFRTQSQPRVTSVRTTSTIGDVKVAKIRSALAGNSHAVPTKSAYSTPPIAASFNTTTAVSVSIRRAARRAHDSFCSSARRPSARTLRASRAMTKTPLACLSNFRKRKASTKTMLLKMSAATLMSRLPLGSLRLFGALRAGGGLRGGRPPVTQHALHGVPDHAGQGQENRRQEAEDGREYAEPHAGTHVGLGGRSQRTQAERDGQAFHAHPPCG